MKCNKAQQWISLQLDGHLPAQNVPQLQEHLGDCAECRGYCDDMLVGRRLLVAARPELSDSFEWNLQLRLNQVIREAAREVGFPSLRPRSDLRRWLTRAGLASTMGLAAVLAVALLVPGRIPLLPEEGQAVQAQSGRPSRLPVKSAESGYGLFESSRRPLDAPYLALSQAAPRGLQRQTSFGGLGGGQASRSTIAGDHDVQRIRRLEQDLEALRRHLEVRDRRIQTLEARLDSLRTLGVDTARGD